MFADVSGFTSLAETMDPEALRDMINACFEELVPVIEKYGGTVDKFIGDEIMALFGAPVAHENDAERALRAALEMIETTSEFNAKRNVDLGLHFGINTGLVIAGGIGPANRQAYTVMGDAVNLASRLEDISERGEILVGPDTFMQSRNVFTFVPLGSVTVKGKTDPVQHYRVTGVKPKPERARELVDRGLSSPLVGRAKDLDTAGERIRQLASGEGGILTIVGDAGVGKSRLLAELRSNNPGEYPEIQWLQGKNASYGDSISYLPFQEIFFEFAGISEDDSGQEAWKKLEKHIRILFADSTQEVLPYIATLVSIPVPVAYEERIKYLDSEAIRRQIFVSSRRFFEQLAKTRPLVLIFEDLHWLDESSALLLAHLLPLVEKAPLLIVGISRPHDESTQPYLKRMWESFSSERYTNINLKPLSLQHSKQLIHNLLAIENLSSHIQESIVNKCEGNPFYLEEIVLTLIETGAVAPDPAKGTWRATKSIEGLTIPDTIHGAIMARFDRLDEELKQVLRAAAVIGRSFHYRLLQALTEMDGKLNCHLVTLQELQLIQERKRYPELEYTFRNALTHEATYQSILLQQRRMLHGHIGETIETSFKKRIDEFSGLLAYHFARGEMWSKAQEYLIVAGDQAERIAADSEALDCYRQALMTYGNAIGSEWDPLQRAGLERKIGEALYRRGENTKALDYLHQALVHIGRKIPQSRNRVRVALVAEAIRQALHRLLPKQFFGRSAASLDPVLEEELQIYRSVLAIASVADGELCLLCALMVLNISERWGYSPGIAIGSATIGFMLDFLSFFGLAERYHKRAIALSDEVELPDVQITAYSLMAIHENIQGRWSATIKYAQYAMGVYRKFGYLHEEWSLVAMCLADGYIHLAYYRQALEYAEELIEVGQDSADRDAWSTGLSRKGFALRCLGRLDESIAALQSAMEIAKSVPNYQTFVDSGGELGQSLLRTGKLDDASKVFDECDQICREQKLFKSPVMTRYMNGKAEVYLIKAERSKKKKAESRMIKSRDAVAKALRQGKAYKPGMPEAMMLKGHFEWIQGGQKKAKKWWDRALSAAEELEIPYEKGRILLTMGRCLGDGTLLEQAKTLFTEIDADWELAQVDREIERSIRRGS